MVICTQNLPSYVNQSLHAPTTSFTIINEHYESLVKKVIINSRATNYFFANHIYFFNYKKYYYEFQIGSCKILIANRYKDIILRLTYLNNSEVICIIKKVSWALSLEYNLLNTIPLAKKGVEIFLWQSHIVLETNHYSSFFRVANIIDN